MDAPLPQLLQGYRLRRTAHYSDDLPLTTALLFVVAVLGKLAAGYFPFWFSCRKAVIGWAMVPRGAVGLVFAQFGLAKGRAGRAAI